MPLDMFQQTQSDTDAYVAQQTSPRLPVTFDEAFEKSWNENRLFGQSTAVLNAHSAALGDYLDEVHRKSGVLISPLNQMGDQKSLDEIGFDVGELRKKRPDLDIPDLTDDDIDRRAVAKSRQARTDYQDMSAAEKTGGGKFGSVLGGLAGGLTDPVNLVAAPLAAPESLGLLGTALAWGAIAGTTQAANEAIGSPYRDKVQPGYSQSAEPAQNILEAAGFGAVTGGGFKALGNVWTRAKTGAWPRSVRDAGNIVESEANVAQTNVLDGLPGEVAHRDALAKTVDDITAGRPTDVGDIVTPDLTHDEAKVEALHEHAQAGSMYLFHGYDSGSGHEFSGFKPLSEVPDYVRYDGGGGVFGNYTYLDPNGKWVTGDNGALGIDRVVKVKADFDKLFVLTPENVDALRDIVGPGAIHSGPEISRRLSEKGYDGIQVKGWDDVPDDARMARTDIDPEILMDQVVSFAPEKSLAIEGDLGLPGRPDPLAEGTTPESRAQQRQVYWEKFRSTIYNQAGDIGKLLNSKSAEDVAKDLVHAAPDQADAMLHDLDKQLAEGDHQIPTGVDQEGNPVFRSFKDMLDEVKADRESAGHLEACLTGADEEATNAE